MNTSIKKSGIINLSTISETFVCPFDPNFYTEPDGSIWIRIFHHNNPKDYLFASTDTFTTNVYKDYNRWFYVSLCNKITNNIYELMIKQKVAYNSNEVKYRWIQTKNPMTATYNETVLANVTRNTSEEYSTYASYAGLYLKNSNTYLAANNGDNNSWWGATGSWTARAGGIPCYASETVTTGYMDLYLRVDNQNGGNPSLFKNAIIANHFYEI